MHAWQAFGGMRGTTLFGIPILVFLELLFYSYFSSFSQIEFVYFVQKEKPNAYAHAHLVFPFATDK